MRITIRSKEGTHAIDCELGERVLFAGLRSGLPLPYECGTGTCGTCKGRLVEGEIQEMWAEAPGREYLKPERREFLMCQAVARGPCEVVVPTRLPAPWANAISPLHHRGTIENVKELTHDVVSFEVDLQQPMNFHPGQFAVLKVPQIEGFRAYSMVNYERDAQRLKFVVKRKPAGKFSDWLFGAGVERTAVELFGPLGKAIFSVEEQKSVLCIAGGSGIAGMMSILSCAAKARYFDHHRGFVFFGVRTMKDVFFLDDLSALVSTFPGRLEVTIAISDEDAPPHEQTSHPALAYATGLVHVVTAQKMVGRYGNAVAFVAGPPPMVDGALRALILEARLPAADIRYDKFT